MHEELVTIRKKANRLATEYRFSLVLEIKVQLEDLVEKYTPVYGTRWLYPERMKCFAKVEQLLLDLQKNLENQVKLTPAVNEVTSCSVEMILQKLGIREDKIEASSVGWSVSLTEEQRKEELRRSALSRRYLWKQLDSVSLMLHGEKPVCSLFPRFSR